MKTVEINIFQLQPVNSGNFNQFPLDPLSPPLWSSFVRIVVNRLARKYHTNLNKLLHSRAVLTNLLICVSCWRNRLAASAAVSTRHPKSVWLICSTKARSHTSVYYWLLATLFLKHHGGSRPWWTLPFYHVPSLWQYRSQFRPYCCEIQQLDGLFKCSQPFINYTNPPTCGNLQIKQ